MNNENAIEGAGVDLILEVRTGRERVTMACHGRLIGGKEADAFRRNAMLLMGGFDNLTISLAGVRNVDCAGFGSLAAVLAYAVDKGKQVRIAHASPLVIQMLRVIHLEQFLDLVTSPGLQLVTDSREAVA
jgi:anti-anti-sigma regulatory factor